MQETQCVSKAVNMLGKKWTIPILYQLCSKKRRFGELQKALTGISPKTLSIRLKELEKGRIVKKRVFPTMPLHVEYALTARGRSLRDIIAKIHTWGERHN